MTQPKLSLTELGLKCYVGISFPKNAATEQT